MTSFILSIKSLLISVLVLSLLMPSSASAILGLSRKERAAKAAEKQKAQQLQRFHGTKPGEHIISGPSNIKHNGTAVRSGPELINKLKLATKSTKPAPKPVAKSTGLLAREAAADKSGKKSFNVPRAGSQRSAPRRQGH